MKTPQKVLCNAVIVLRIPSEISGGTIVQQTTFSKKKVATAVNQPCVQG